ncbi:hypothetical protein [Saccharomonospora cyanea]|uniref:Uncharacterized protein n=1 Tax=Saccharomonospora cyanea NA-134 TaxID=882082 RepID=H5XLI3_9PSEU|nr:hypothetical protein [Saccharomonospora cyanea]EHR59852.1 hypothetical protein SaccyDRAFT_0939 [Saccharomonospora cyanea NA-134]
MTKNGSGHDVGRLSARVLAAAFGALVLGLLARELPAVVRYAKIRSM